MNRIYAFVVGLAVLLAPAAAAGLAAADPGTRSMDNYQQATDVVVMRGLAQRGVPFSWAGGGVAGPTRGTGTGINTVGFDASGLMQYAYAGAGIKLPRSSGAMYKVGQKVLPQQARRGDLIFYGPDGTQSVAMYLGNGQMLEVGDVVQVSPVRGNGMAPYVVRVLGTQQAPSQQVPQQQTPAQQAPLQQTPAQQLPGQQTPAQQQLPGQQVPAQVPLQQQAPLQQLPLQQTPQQALQQVPAQQTPLVPAQQSPLIPTQQTPLAPAQQVPLQQAPLQQAPLQQAPGLQLPAQQAPLQQTQQQQTQQQIPLSTMR
jgi:hypothetical protein